jgi:ABC-type sugar transport system substrate-binding protein
MNIRTAACAALLALTVALTAAPPAARAADPYEIDAILPQSGNGAFLGTRKWSRSSSSRI